MAAQAPGQLAEHRDAQVEPRRDGAVPSTIDPHAVDDLHDMCFVIASGLPRVVYRYRVRFVPRYEPEVPRAQAEVRLLRVQEVGLVPPACALEALPRDE